MNKVTVNVAPFRVYAGTIVGLDDGQARARAHSLRATPEPGCYEVLNTIEFKRGESLSLDTAGLSRVEQVAIGLGGGARPATQASEPADKPRKPAKAHA